MTFVSEYVTQNITINDTEPRCAPSVQSQSQAVCPEPLDRIEGAVPPKLWSWSRGQECDDRFRVAETSIYMGRQRGTFRVE